jgi:imidazolonepropionase-like amidohydrolase
MPASSKGLSIEDRIDAVESMTRGWQRISITGTGLALCALLFCGCAQRESVDLVIRNATIIDIESGKTNAGHAVVVNNGLVQHIIPNEQTSAFEAAREIDGGDGFLIPALADAHVHLRYPSELENYLRYGVGLVINMSGGPMHLALRDAVEERPRQGPRIVTVGPTLDGSSPTNPLFTSVTPETATEIVDWIADQGYDAVKVYQQIDTETLRAVIRAAESRNMITTGHVSRTAGVQGALEAGLRYVAHGEELAFEAFSEKARRFDRSRIPELAALLADHGATVTPMINYLEEVPGQVLGLDDYLESDPMSLVPAAMKLSFGPRQGWFSGRDEPAAFAEQMADVAGFVSELTGALNERGVPLILGTDAGFGGAIPGYSVHRELQSLVLAGLSELEALQTATLNVGRYLQQIDSSRTPWGRIEPGFSADLLLLRGNPLEEISTTEQIEGIALAGRWYTHEDLMGLERELRSRQGALMSCAQAFEEALVSGDVAGAREAVDSRPQDLKDESLIGPDNCIFLGYRFYYRGQRELAGKLYEICAEMHPGMPPLWWHIGRAREEGGEREGAIRAYSRALDANPWYGQPADAIRRLEEIAE